MKKLYFLPLIVAVVVLLTVTSCEKKKLEKTGKFIYLTESIYDSYSKKEIYGIFFNTEQTAFITGHIPKKFQTTDTIDVQITIKEIFPADKYFLCDYPYVVYKIISIKEK